MLTIADYFWRLVPANPILLRVVQMNGKRRRDLFIRCGYLGLLIAVVLFGLTGGAGSSGNLAELAKTSANLFQSLSYCQLALVALLAPIFTAGAITQERDSQTYDILLTTPLSNGQIVLGSLLSRLFFVVALLVSGVPIFSITQIFGGVAISAIVQSFFIAAATAFITGAVAMAIAVLKVGTRRTIFSFYMFTVVYLAGTYFLDQWPALKVSVVNPATNVIEASHTSWMTAINPFLALRTIFHDSQYMPPNLGDLPEALRFWPVGWALSSPAAFFVWFSFFISFVLISPSILLLRRLAQSTSTIYVDILRKLHILRGDRTRKPRSVWSNPIAWREASTKASAARGMLLRYAFIVLGIGGAIVILYLFASLKPPRFSAYIDATSYNASLGQLTVYYADGLAKTKRIAADAQFFYTDEETFNDQAFDAQGNPTASPKMDRTPLADVTDLLSHIGHSRASLQATPRIAADGTELEWVTLDVVKTPRRLSADDTRKALLGATIVEFSVILLIVTNAAASTVTREKEDGTLDLLLSTPITSRYYVWGKLRGLVSFVLPLLAVPMVSVAFFVAYDLFRAAGGGSSARAFQPVVFPEALVLLPGMMVIVVAFAAMLGMNMSLRLRRTTMAVMSSVGIIAAICAGLGWCGYNALMSHSFSGAGPALAGFSPFTLIMALIDPYAVNSGAFSSDNMDGNRVLVAIFTVIAVGIYTAVVFAMYGSMVKNFDMTIRKQAR